MSASELQKALGSTRELKITVKGRKSGREISLPVWFVYEGTKLHLLPVEGSSTNWFRNLLNDSGMKISVKGVESSVQARPVTQSQKVIEVADKFRARYGTGEVRKYYSRFDVCVELKL